eukprot:scaffold271704_cov23-Tisochrysis_lutea.AAC.3
MGAHAAPCASQHGMSTCAGEEQCANRHRAGTSDHCSIFVSSHVYRLAVREESVNHRANKELIEGRRDLRSACEGVDNVKTHDI